jgi:hypothetical protein
MHSSDSGIARGAIACWGEDGSILVSYQQIFIFRTPDFKRPCPAPFGHDSPKPTVWHPENLEEFRFPKYYSSTLQDILPLGHVSD